MWNKCVKSNYGLHGIVSDDIANGFTISTDCQVYGHNWKEQFETIDQVSLFNSDQFCICSFEPVSIQIDMILPIIFFTIFQMQSF